MNFNLLSNPDRIVGWVFRWFIKIIALVLAVTLAVRLIEQFPFLGAILAISLVAALVIAFRNRQGHSQSRQRTINRAERIPLMPPASEDEQ